MKATPENFPGIDLEVERLVDQVRGCAFRLLAGNGFVPTDAAVRGLAAVILVSSAEDCAGGNPERPAFKAYSESLMVVAENTISGFVTGARRGG